MNASDSISGSLLKRGHIVKSWRKRWFILRGNTLRYSVTEGSEPKGFFELTKNTTVRESTLQPHCFLLTDGVRDLYMAAGDETEMTEWMESLQETILSQSFTASMSMGLGTVRLKRTIPALENANTLTVRLGMAKGVTAKNKNNTSNPYAIVMVGSESSRSSTKIGELNPTWNEVFTFPFDRTLRFARIELWDEDSTGKDRFLGLVMLPLFMLNSGAISGGWYGLGKRSPRSSVSGALFVEVSCNVEIEVVADQIFKDISKLPELSLLPYLDSPGLINRNFGVKNVVPYFAGEILEDMSMHVILKVDQGGETYYGGLMALTNYRLIFVGASRLNSSRRGGTEVDLEDNGDVCMYVSICSIVNVSIGEEPDYMNPSLSINTMRLKISDSRVYHIFSTRS